MGSVEEITRRKLKSNGEFSIVRDAYDKKQHPNQQGGLDKYIDVLDHSTGNINSVKLYVNTKGLHFKKNGIHYIEDFVFVSLYVPYQIYVSKGNQAEVMFGD
jgi:hypothetical protein